MKRIYFTLTLYTISAISAIVIYFYLLPEFIKDGGYLIIVLLGLSLVLVGLIVERWIIFYSLLFKIKNDFSENVISLISNRNWMDLKLLLVTSSTIIAKVVMTTVVSYEREMEKSNNHEKRMTDLTNTVSSSLSSEQPKLEQNLTAISTIASISTMVGLLGTTLGMIRSFRALSQTGAPDAVQLSLGISEALINTAGGLIVAILAIVAYNYFVSTIDRYFQEHTEYCKKILTTFSDLLPH